MVVAPPGTSYSRRRFRYAGIFLLLLLLVATPLLLAREYWLTRIGMFLVRTDPLCHADVAVVLGGDENGRRILQAASLARDGYASKVIVDGPESNYDFTDDQLAIPFAVKRGFPVDMFIGLPMNVRSTEAEAGEVVKEIVRRGWSRFILVTSNFHTRRAGKIFQRAISHTNLTFCVAAAPSRDFTPEGWWKSREGRKVVFYEWSKTISDWLNS